MGKCKIKESDLFVSLEVKDKMFDMQNIFKRKEMKEQKVVDFPVRAIMNNATVSLYTGDEVESMFLSFVIKQTSFHRASKQGCFQLYESSNKYITLCPFGCENGSTQGLEEWDYDFNLFKYQCAYKKDDKDARELRRRLDDKINAAKGALMAEQADKIRKKTKKEEKKSMVVLVKKTNGIALQAIQKELNLEAMIQKEEEEKIEREKAEIMMNIEKERKKKQCVQNAIRERELENQYNLHAAEAEKQIQTIKKQTAQQVLIRRNALNSKLRLIRQKAEREKNKLKQKLQGVRNSIPMIFINTEKEISINVLSLWKIPNIETITVLLISQMIYLIYNTVEIPPISVPSAVILKFLICSSKIDNNATLKFVMPYPYLRGMISQILVVNGSSRLILMPLYLKINKLLLIMESKSMIVEKLFI